MLGFFEAIGIAVAASYGAALFVVLLAILISPRDFIVAWTVK